MRNFLILIFIAFLDVTEGQAQDCFLGFWESEDKSQIIKIYKNISYYGEIVYLKDIGFEKLKRKVVLVQMIKKNEKVLYGGTFYNHKKNKEYEAKIKLINKNTIKFKGYYGLMNEIRYWRRVVVN